MFLSSSITTTTLNLILLHLYRIGGPLLILIGTIGSTMMIILFTRKAFCQYPSSIYIISRNISNLCFIYFSILYETLVVGYSIALSSTNLAYCRFSCYTTLVFDILSPFYLLLALIDRYLVTSVNVNIRKYSTHRLACPLSICILIFWLLFHIHALFNSKIIQTESEFTYCYYQPGLYSTFITYYSLISKGILAPLSLIYFGLQIVRNYRRRSHQVSISSSTVDKNHFSSTVRCRDRATVLILLKDILMYILFSSIMSIYFMYELITEHQAKNLEQRDIEYIIRYLGIFCVCIPFCIGFYTNLLISKTFRREVRNLMCIHRRK
ncbi:unnamed protein product [Adineta ricciae]|uniref:G-protein coupled receptors family 1 profile domain-containing protein n=1 Tax=Adineta ricciae TaxID=249248 RepID=A0A815HC19_ADIRI|nr:unnamed protein product [Adineta ricciae]CAF1352552.1 unnamed protein product [Adineta ricciae]